MFKYAKISWSKLFLQREFTLALFVHFGTLFTLSFACFKLLDLFSSKSNSEKLQLKKLPDNCQLQNLQDMLCKTAAMNIGFSI